jgi:DNA-binding transcriptional regulator YbjK
MSPKSDRREHLADAALVLLSHEGAHGVTHRAVDAQAQVPPGTTSRYFRTRAALFQGAAERMRDRHREQVQRLAGKFPHNSGGLVEALVELLDDASGPNRELYTARFELALQSIRQPELAGIMQDIRADALDVAQRLIGSTGAVWTDEQIEILGSMLLGISIDRITLGIPRAGNLAVATAIVRGLTP